VTGGAGQAAGGRRRREPQRPAGPSRQQPDRGGGQRAVPEPREHGQRWVEQEEAGRLPGLGRAPQLRPVRLDLCDELRLGARGVADAERLGDPGGIGDVPVASGLVQRVGAEHLVCGEEAVDLRHVHPPQQVWVGGGVGPAVRRGAADPLVHVSNRGDHLLRVVAGAEGGDREEVAGALQPAPGVTLEARVLRDTCHRQRVQRLEQQCPDPADEHRGVAVHPPDRTVLGEPPLPGRGMDPVTSPWPLLASDTAEQLLPHPTPNALQDPCDMLHLSSMPRRRSTDSHWLMTARLVRRRLPL